MGGDNGTGYADQIRYILLIIAHITFIKMMLRWLNTWLFARLPVVQYQFAYRGTMGICRAGCK